MAKGQTVSVTLPHVVVKEYDKQAAALDTSRGSILRNIIMDDYKNKMNKSEVKIDITDKPSA